MFIKYTVLGKEEKLKKFPNKKEWRKAGGDFVEKI